VASRSLNAKTGFYANLNDWPIFRELDRPIKTLAASHDAAELAYLMSNGLVEKKKSVPQSKDFFFEPRNLQHDIFCKILNFSEDLNGTTVGQWAVSKAILFRTLLTRT
jgi:hypothetical protein